MKQRIYGRNHEAGLELPYIQMIFKQGHHQGNLSKNVLLVLPLEVVHKHGAQVWKVCESEPKRPLCLGIVETGSSHWRVEGWGYRASMKMQGLFAMP